MQAIPSMGNLGGAMLKKVLLNFRRKLLLRRFKCFDIKYHSRELGKAMAFENGEFMREYHHEKLRESIQKVCEDNGISHRNLLLIEDELNDYINGLANEANDAERQKQKVREFLDTRIKVKRADVTGLNGSSSTNEPEPEV